MKRQMLLGMFVVLAMAGCVPVKYDVRQVDGTPVETIELLQGYNSTEFTFKKPGDEHPYRKLLCSEINNTLGQPARCVEAK